MSQDIISNSKATQDTAILHSIPQNDSQPGNMTANEIISTNANTSAGSNEDNTNEHSHKLSNLSYASMTFLIGGIAGSAAKTVVAPLDRVKILFQTGNPKFEMYTHARYGLFKAGKAIFKEYGVIGLFRGHSMQLARIYPYAAIKFMSYEQIKKFLIPTPDKSTNIKHFASGAGAGVISVFMTFPFDMIRVRMAYQTPALNSRPERIGETISKIYNEKASSRIPIFNFYRGFFISVVGMIPYGGVSFLTHNNLVNFFKKFPEYTTLRKSQLELQQEQEQANTKPSHLGRIKKKKSELRAWAELTAGGLSGIAAQTCSYPLELIRRQLQVSGIHSPEKMLNAWQVTKSIYSAHGFRGFFVGLTIGYIKVVPMFAVSFYTYEKLKSLTGID